MGRWMTVGLLLAVSWGTLASASEILPPDPAWEGKSRGLTVKADDPWITPAEESGLTRTPRYPETVAWLKKLVAAAPQLQMVSLGKSPEGRDIWMVIASKEGAATPTALRKNGRPTLLAQAGIHSGEIDGKDAGMMLLRDMTVGKKQSSLLDGANLLFVPILSVDAHERFSEFSRINQRGPAEMGWRTNARNLNLNRDYTKLETGELRALVAAVLAWSPDLYLDLHVTDGADYQYDSTFGYNGTWGWSPKIAAWLDDTYRPAIHRQLSSMGHVPGPLIFTANGRDMSAGYVHWTASPRFSNGWGDARHLPTVLLENHSLKPYDRRVLGTYVFLEGSMRVLAESGDTLRKAVETDRTAFRDDIPLGFRVSQDRTPEVVEFLSIRSEDYLSPISGTINVRWTGEPITERIPRLVFDEPTITVQRPAAYMIPAAWSPLIDLLRRQGIQVEKIEKAQTMSVEIYRLPEAELDADATPFEGRARYKAGVPTTAAREVRYPAGSYRVATDQSLGTLAVLMLEPQSGDSLFAWGYMASILQRTEYVENYAVEPMAREMLARDPALRAEFEEKLKNDAAFAADAKARLAWFYERSPYYDSAYRVYPIGRIFAAE